MSTTPAAAPAPAAPAAGTTLMTAPPAGAPAAPGADGSAPPAGDSAPAAPAGGAPASNQPGDAGQNDQGDKPGETDEQKAERVAAEAAEAAKNAGAPEKYEPFTPPEGSQLDDTVMGQFSDVARELNLPQDKAQLLIDKVAPVIAQRQAEQIEAVRTEWHAQATTDKEFGGDKLGENLAVAKTAMDKFATPELTQLLNETGLGNHPEVIRFMVRAGKAISEDGVVTGGVPGATTQRSAADVLYGSSALKK